MEYTLLPYVTCTCVTPSAWPSSLPEAVPRRTTGGWTGAAASWVIHYTTTASGLATWMFTCSGTPSAEVQNAISPVLLPAYFISPLRSRAPLLLR